MKIKNQNTKHGMALVNELIIKKSPYTSADDKISRSIGKNGFFSYVVVNEKNNHVVIGGNRALSAIKAGIKEIPAIYIDIPESEEMLFTMADNESILAASYGDGIKALCSELEELNLSGPALLDDYESEIKKKGNQFETPEPKEISMILILDCPVALGAKEPFIELVKTAFGNLILSAE